MYDSVLHSYVSLTNVDNFNYRLSSLSEIAFDLIQGIPLSGDNYIAAYHKLKKMV